MTTVEITWKAFGERPNKKITSVRFETNFKVQPHQDKVFCDVAYDNTNRYEGNMWNIIEPLLDPNRTHTALSVGDEIRFHDENGTRAYRCADFGWDVIGSVEFSEIK